jgi:hypothetical protein
MNGEVEEKGQKPEHRTNPKQKENKQPSPVRDQAEKKKRSLLSAFQNSSALKT